MNDAGTLLGALALLAVIVNGLLKKVEKSFKKFPWCHRCGKNMINIGLTRTFPEELLRHLDKHKLPIAVISRYMCPKGDYQLWYVPRFGSTEKAFFLKEEL